LWFILFLALATAAPNASAAQPATAPVAASAPRPLAHVLIVDFACEDGELGKTVAQNVRMRLARHEEYFVLDRISTQDLTSPLGAEADANQAITLLTRAGCDVAFWGTVRKNGGTVTADVRCANANDPTAAGAWRKQFTDTTERAPGLIATKIVEALTGHPEWVPPQVGDEPEPALKALGKPLNVNGDFEQGAKGWQGPDNVASFLEAGPHTGLAAAGRGTVLRIRTDLARDPWLEYYRNLRLGLADANHPPAIATDTSYNSVAGLEGVHFNSDWLPATPGARYWLTADVKKPGGTPKIFVKGFIDWSAQADGLPELSMVERKLTPQAFAALTPEERKKLIAEDAAAHGDRYRRESYRWFLNCIEGGKDWTHHAAPFPPRGGLPKNVQWLQIQVYAYWPPGTYYFDNVHLYKDPTQKAPLPEEPARTDNFDKSRQQTVPK
jgi:hypothetical protein